VVAATSDACCSSIRTTAVIVSCAAAARCVDLLAEASYYYFWCLNTQTHIEVPHSTTHATSSTLAALVRDDHLFDQKLAVHLLCTDVYTMLCSLCCFED
jgi:hypothetical protein